MRTVDGNYACDVCGKVTTPDLTRHTFLASLDLGHRRRMPPIVMDFCSKAHAMFYWRGSRFYEPLFAALSIRIEAEGIYYVCAGATPANAG